MEQSPLVSVIIPNYNHAKYLDDRLQSVLSQTYRNIEVIILDDHSTDDSLSVIDKYICDKRVTKVIVNEENGGNTFKQWNKGIHLAKGDLIWIAESDDFCELNLLEELVKAYNKKKNTVLAYSTVTFADENGNKGWHPKQTSNKYYSSKHFLRHYLSLGNEVLNASCAIFCRQAALNVPDDYIGYSGAGDYLFWVQIAAQGNVAIVNKNLSYFRRHSGVVTSRHDADGSNFQAEKTILEVIEKHTIISALRKRLIYAHRAFRIKSTQFISHEVEDIVFCTWDVSNHSGKLDRMLLRLAKSLRVRYNYYL